MTFFDTPWQVVVGIVVGVILGLAALAAIYRIARGPSLLDRVIASDVLLATFSAALATEMALNRHLDNLPLLVGLTVVGFIAAVTVARYVAEQRQEAP
ncbi:monovalent cation/H+ antiporter complex subunit F [Acaricomes phytoseiuli]|uniref:monovalent cation/H+ antiporter complex subunit F n=1 Tax=Acaricomes phytoseiuli TaxID=291968 RepID=UPI00038073C5|nr:monovalent cation/H+ antiporter complex subunit F [Acaricomes phytoseiuli]MCW1248909.1 monovalent cation/H+ antiporter complex subunit F [Acaricomes phytoseiuli]